jgi:hypothetical protein
MNDQTMREIEADNGRKIRVYDNVFEWMYRSILYQFAKSSLFRIGWADSSMLEKAHYHYLHSAYSEEDIARIGLLDRLMQSSVRDELTGYNVAKCVLNLSTPADVNFVHAHPEDKIILIYVNLEWEDGWHGETLFYSESQKDVMFASPFTPNRVVVFDPKIPHTIRPQSYIAPFYRFTLAIILTKAEVAPEPQAG